MQQQTSLAERVEAHSPEGIGSTGYTTHCCGCRVFKYCPYHCSSGGHGLDWVCSDCAKRYGGKCPACSAPLRRI